MTGRVTPTERADPLVYMDSAGRFPAGMQYTARVVVEMPDEAPQDQPQQQRCRCRPDSLRAIRRADPEGIAPLPPQYFECLHNASCSIIDVGLFRDDAVQLDHLEPRQAQRIGTRRDDVKPAEDRKSTRLNSSH